GGKASGEDDTAVEHRRRDVDDDILIRGAAAVAYNGKGRPGDKAGADDSVEYQVVMGGSVVRSPGGSKDRTPAGDRQRSTGFAAQPRGDSRESGEVRTYICVPEGGAAVHRYSAWAELPHVHRRELDRAGDGPGAGARKSSGIADPDVARRASGAEDVRVAEIQAVRIAFE